MDETRIKQLYREHGRRREVPLAAGDVELIIEAMTRRPGLTETDTALDRVAASPTRSDVMRAVAGLDADIAALSASVGGLRRSGPVAPRRWLRGGLALAASLAALGVFVLMQPGPVQDPNLIKGVAASAEQEKPAAVIASLSFESGPLSANEPSGPAQKRRADTIFVGNFSGT